MGDWGIEYLQRLDDEDERNRRALEARRKRDAAEENRILLEEIEALKRERDIFRIALSGLAEGDCYYGDDCPSKARHGQCYACMARQALSEAKS
jgi:hypothetical protein